LAEVQAWVTQAELALHPDKTRIVDAANAPFEFLGFRFDQGRKWPRDQSKAKLRATVRVRTPRTSGTRAVAGAGDRTINAGPTCSWPRPGCSLLEQARRLACQSMKMAH
jgi:hypothetical protein